MKLSMQTATLFAARHAPYSIFAAPARCPACGDLMVAPISSEFVEGGEVRHHWECESCGEVTSTSVPVASHETDAVAAAE